MSKNYTHSLTFDSLKSAKEVITENLTSLQYLQTLDMFLWRALEPIVAECPSLFNNYICKVAARQSLKPATKVTSDDKSKLLINMFNTITAGDTKSATEHARKMYVNRGILFGFLALFLNHLRHYEKLHQPYSKLDPIVRQSRLYQIERTVGLRQGSSLYAVLQQVRYWDNKARWFKGLIIQKYTRLALTHAQSTYRDYNHYIPLDDVVNIHLMIVNKAIDRCNPRLGVITTFMTNWFKTARSEVGELAKSQSDSSFESLNDENGDSISELVGFTELDTSKETIEHLSYIAKKIDKFGYIRSTLGIPEFVTKQQYQTLLRFSIES